MEAEMVEEAIGVLEGLVEEEDGSVEGWYLGGWCLYLLAGKAGRKQQESEKEKKACLVGSREWLRESLRLYQLIEYEDERLREHAVELVGEIDGELGSSGEDIDEESAEQDAWEFESEPESDKEEEAGKTTLKTHSIQAHQLLEPPAAAAAVILDLKAHNPNHDHDHDLEMKDT